VDKTEARIDSSLINLHLKTETPNSKWTFTPTPDVYDVNYIMND